MVSQVSKSNATVLVRGESGTGKELVANSVHYNSHRAQQPFVKINCAAIPANLIESELFGHEKGAFTGAINQKLGKFELANRGTLFLDEIGSIGLDVQVNLLRVLQEREFMPVGSTIFGTLPSTQEYPFILIDRCMVPGAFQIGGKNQATAHKS